jgi:hypothetical protein
VTQTQLAKGLARAHDRLEDSKLDCPQAEQLLHRIEQDGYAQGWLERDGSS